MKQFQDQLKIISSCPVCNSRNFAAQIKIINESEDAHLLHIQCKKCKSCVLVLVMMDQQGLSSVGFLTDLNSQEIFKFSHGHEVNADDVLNLVDLLKKDKINCLF